MEVYFNKPQLLTQLIGANISVIVAGRRTGKTDSIAAPFVLRNMQRMPGSTGGIVVPTFKHGLTNTLPGLFAAWKRWGYIRGIHYVIGRKPPRTFAKPIIEPAEYEHVISFYNGSCAVIISQDRPGSSNSLTLSWLLIDEAKFINYNKLKDETLPANGGIKTYFGKHSCNHSIMILSDMPQTKKGSWFLQYEKLMDKELIKIIEGLVYYEWQVKQRMKDHPERYDHYLKELSRINQQLAFFRKQAYLYLERPSIYNLAVLGEDFIRRMKRELPPLVFATSIMCKRITIAYDGFYGAMREDVNLYTAPNTSRLSLANLGDGSIAENDCRNDADLDPEAPLMCAFDANDNINWMVVGQLGNDGKLRVIKSFYVKYDRKLEALCDDFCEYYKYHKTKALVFFFDHTFVGNGYAVSQNRDFYSFISSELSSHGWLVDEVYIGRAKEHDVKCQLINRMFVGRADHQILINRDNKMRPCCCRSRRLAFI